MKNQIQTASEVKNSSRTRTLVHETCKKVVLIQKQCVVVIGMVCIILSACSSPEKDGIKAAKIRYNCENDYDVALNKAYVSYIKKFNFTTRVDARENLIETLRKVDANYQDCGQKASEYRDKLGSKYLTNEEKTEKFKYAFRNASDDYSKKRQNNKLQEDICANSSKIGEMILSIIPSKPDLEKLKKDLIGREIKTNYNQQDAPNFTEGGYVWVWKINSIEELKEVEIRNIIDKSDEYLLEVHMRLKGDINQFDANVNITYVLQHFDDWTIKSFESEMNIIRTDKYDNCIKAELQRYDAGNYDFVNRLIINNLCDYDLVVGGVWRVRVNAYWGNNHTYNFTIKLNANGTVRYGGSIINGPYLYLYSNVFNYEIHYIERQGL